MLCNIGVYRFKYPLSGPGPTLTAYWLHRRLFKWQSSCCGKTFVKCCPVTFWEYLSAHLQFAPLGWYFMTLEIKSYPIKYMVSHIFHIQRTIQCRCRVHIDKQQCPLFSQHCFPSYFFKVGALFSPFLPERRVVVSWKCGFRNLYRRDYFGMGLRKMIYVLDRCNLSRDIG